MYYLVVIILIRRIIISLNKGVDFLSLSDTLRDSLQQAKKEQESTDMDTDSKTLNNFSTVLEKLSEVAINQVATGQIKIEDTKDLRDLAAIYSMLKQVNDSGDAKATPEISGDAFNYLNKQLGLNISLEDAKNKDISDNVEGLSEDDVNKLLDDQFNSLNKKNEKDEDNKDDVDKGANSA